MICRALSGKLHSAFAGKLGEITHAGYSKDGSSIVVASHIGFAQILDAATGHEKVRLQGHSGAMTDAKFNADSGLGATTSEDKMARVFDTARGLLVHKLQGCHLDR